MSGASSSTLGELLTQFRMHAYGAYRHISFEIRKVIKPALSKRKSEKLSAGDAIKKQKV